MVKFNQPTNPLSKSAALTLGMEIEIAIRSSTVTALRITLVLISFNFLSTFLVYDAALPEKRDPTQLDIGVTRV